jgi:phage-related protein
MQDLWKKNFELADIQERVNMVGDLVDANFKGQAVAAGTTLYGAIDKLKNNFGNFMEVIGEALNRYLGPLVSKLAEWFGQFTNLDSIIKMLNPTLKFLSDNLGWIAGAIVGALIPAFYALGVSIWTALAPLLPFIAAGAALGLIAKLIIDNWGQISQFLAPLLPLWTLLKDIFTALWSTLKDQLLPIWDQLKTALEPLMPLLKLIAEAIGIMVLGSIVSIIAGLVLFMGILAGVISAVSTFVTGVVQYFSGIVQYFTGFWMIIQGLFTGNWQMVIDGFNKMKDGVISIFTGLYNMTIGTVYKLVDGIVNYFFNLYQQLIGHSIIPDIVNGIIAWFNKLPSLITKALSGVYDSITSPFSSAFSWISGQISSLSSKLSSLAAKAASSLGLKARALGGPVAAGQPYMVGENGPEMFVPYNSGKIIPNGKVGGTSSITVNFYGDVKNTDDKSLDEIGSRVARQMELARFGVL